MNRATIITEEGRIAHTNLPDYDLAYTLEYNPVSYTHLDVYKRQMHDLMVHDYGPGHRIVSFHAEVPEDGDMAVSYTHLDVYKRQGINNGERTGF